MGLIGEGISEVIATTRGNAAPIGVHCRDGEYRMVLFRGSHTAGNIERDGWVVANIIHDPVLYVETAFSDLPPDAFIAETAGGQEVQRLAAAEAWVAFDARVARTTAETLIVDLRLLREEILSSPVYPVNRGFSSVIEATVHATRNILWKDPALAGLIRHHASIVRRCGGPRELEALELLLGHCPDV